MHLERGYLAHNRVAMVGALFSSDAWNNVTFTAGEVRNPKRNLPLSLACGRGCGLHPVHREQTSCI